MSLRVADTINVPTKTGEYQIQLCYGDITAIEEKMDIIMVSAFPGDYAAVSGTLIGALKRNLGIDVSKLARDKDIDLRTHFSCWISKDLDLNVPYKRLLCFERSRSKGDFIGQMRDMFRALVPACGTQETTVISPLLGAGNQGHSEASVLQCIVEGAANWMQAGLPLKCMKLVIYEADNRELNDLFSRLKKKLDKHDKKKKKKDREEASFDVFITYEENDKEWLDMVCKTLQRKSKDLKIYKEIQKFDQNQVWQENVFKCMTCSKMIIALLTPSFVISKDCLDQFNMAMCCNRLKKSQLLFPFLLATVDTMPIYMKLVQYYDCRIRREGDVLQGKIDSACAFILDPSNLVGQENQSTKERFDYDIFISYSHRQPKQAQDMLQILSSGNSDLKIFFDRSELTMGSIWQSSLYQALDNSECIIAFLSPEYCSSTVCQEEYNISLARYLSNPSEVLFIPVLVEPMEIIPSHFGRIPVINGVGEKFEDVVHLIAKDVIEWRLTGVKIPYVQTPTDVFNLRAIEQIRAEYITDNYVLDCKMKNISSKAMVGNLETSKLDIAISFARDSIPLAGTLSNIFSKYNENLNVSFLSENAAGSLQDLDIARQIIIILSKEYIQSAHHMQELHVALCRQRDSKDKLIVRILASDYLPDKPMFVHFLPFETCLTDKIWQRYEKMSAPTKDYNKKSVMSRTQGIKGTFSIAYGTYYGLQKTADEVLLTLSGSNKQNSVVPPIITNILQEKIKRNGLPPTTKMSDILIEISSEKTPPLVEFIQLEESVLDTELQPVDKKGLEASSVDEKMKTNHDDKVKSAEIQPTGTKDVKSAVLNSTSDNKLTTNAKSKEDLAISNTNSQSKEKETSKEETTPKNKSVVKWADNSNTDQPQDKVTNMNPKPNEAKGKDNKEIDKTHTNENTTSADTSSDKKKSSTCNLL